MASLALPQATARVLLQLQLEFDDFPAYRAVLWRFRDRSHLCGALFMR